MAAIGLGILAQALLKIFINLSNHQRIIVDNNLPRFSVVYTAIKLNRARVNDA
jgi:hypothetical protein